MGGIPPQYVTKPTQPCIPRVTKSSSSLNLPFHLVAFLCFAVRRRHIGTEFAICMLVLGLPPTKLGTYLETRVNSLLKRKDAGAGEVTIRVLSSYDKAVDVKPGMRSRFSDMAESFPYRVKAMFAFEEIDGVDVCFFGMHVQEYGSDCPPPNTRSVYSYLWAFIIFYEGRCFSA